MNVEARCAALRDCRGRYHVARLLARLPDVGTALDGMQPVPGFAIVYDCAGDDTFRLLYVLTGCDQDSALARLRPQGPDRSVRAPHEPRVDDHA